MKSAIVEAWDSGASKAAIAKRFNIHHRTVKRVLEAAGRKVEKRYASQARQHLWKGGRIVLDGYVLVRGAPVGYESMLRSNGYVPEHRLIVAQSLGRPLRSAEQVHHRDGNRSNNALSNLQLRVGPHGSGQAARCASCGSCDIRFEEI